MTPVPDPRSLASAQLLRELVDNPLDPGYAAAAARRPPGARPSRWATPAVALACALIGFTVVLAYVHTHRGAPAAAKAQQRLVARARAAQRTADGLDDQVDRLNVQVMALRDRALPHAGGLAAQVSSAAFAAGQTPAVGPGLTVTLSDPSAPSAAPTAARAGSVPITATNTLTDRDVRSVVNELWHAGAEAVAVNDIRLGPTSAIRFAGQAILVDFQPVSSPYRISAIGNPDRLSVDFAQSAVATRYQTLEGVEGIGFSFANADRIVLPAANPITLHYARAGTAGR